MQNKIVQFRQKENPHCQGQAICMDCNHQWQAVAPFSVTWLECPGCGASKGHFVYPVVRETSHWVCNCGNALFHVTPDGPYCPNCGEWVHG